MEVKNIRQVFLGIGSNLGAREGNLRHAVNMIGKVTATAERE